jgi:hypothetical protein
MLKMAAVLILILALIPILVLLQGRNGRPYNGVGTRTKSAKRVWGRFIGDEESSKSIWVESLGVFHHGPARPAWDG